MVNSSTQSATAGSETNSLFEGYFANNGLSLAPTSTLWSLACAATDEIAIRRLTKIKRANPGLDYEVLVSDVLMLNHFAADIPPKIETLFAFLTRPLSVALPASAALPSYLKNENGEVFFRLAQSSLEKQYITAANGPVLLAYAEKPDGSFATKISDVSSFFIENVDHIINIDMGNSSTNTPCVAARMGSKDELEFIRE